MSSAARKLAVSPEVAAPKRPNLTLVPTINEYFGYIIRPLTGIPIHLPTPAMRSTW